MKRNIRHFLTLLCSLVSKRFWALLFLWIILEALFKGPTLSFALCNKKSLLEIKGLLNEYCIYRRNLFLLKGLNCSNLKNLLPKIDPYARLVSDSQKNDLKEISGVGALLLEKDRGFILVPYKFSPLFKISRGKDLSLISIDNKRAKGMKYEEVVRLLRGKEGTVVKLLLRIRERKRTIYVVRERYTLPSIEFLKIERDLLVRIFNFKRHEISTLLINELRQKDFSKVIIDLRGCPGGDLFEALDVAGIFLRPSTTLVYLKDRTGKLKKISVPSSLPTFRQKIDILVGPRTASAAEIFTGILKHYKRARIKGKKTKGKCVSQGEFILSDGSILRVSNEWILFPDMTSCQGKGIFPDRK